MNSSDAPRSPAKDTSVESVLVPLDGSVAAELAIETGATLACRSGARLHLAGIVRADGAKLDLGEGVEVAQPGSHEYAAQLDEYVARMADVASRRFACPVDRTVVTADDPADGLVEFQRRVGVDLTVMAIPVPHDPARHLLSEAATRDAPSPVLFLPVSSGDDGIRHVLPPRYVEPRVVAVIVHTTGRHDTVLECAETFGRLWGAALRLIDGTALEPSNGEAARTDAAEAQGRRQRLEALAEAMSAEGLDAEAWFLEDPSSQGALLAALEAGEVDIVIAGYAAKPLSERLLFGPPEGRAAPGRERRVGVLVCPS